MPAIQKPGKPWLYDAETGDIIGVKDPDGSEQYFATSREPIPAGAVPVVGQFNELTGALEKFTAGAREYTIGNAKRIHPAMAMHLFGNLASAQTTQANTYFSKFAVPCEFDAVKLVIYHHGSTTPTVKGVVAATETAAQDTDANRFHPIVGGTAYNAVDGTEAYGFKSVTWGGASTKAFAGSGTQFAPEVLISDLIPLSSVPRADGGTLPLLMARVYCDGSAQTITFVSQAGFSALRDPATANGGYIVQVGSRNADAIATPGSTPAALATTTLSIGVILFSRRSGISLMTIGDSITQNDALVADKVSSWGARAAHALSTIERPISYVNAGCSGQTGATYTTNGLVQLGNLKPNVAHFSGWTPNDYSSPTAASLRLAVQKMAGNLHKFLDFCYTNKIVPIVSNGIPHSAATGLNTSALDAQRIAYNARLQEMADEGLFYLADFDAELSDGATPAAIKTAYSAGDGIHPNEAGIAAMGVVFQSALAKAFL
jgi:lysophospholipase L1-like esterase